MRLRKRLVVRLDSQSNEPTAEAHCLQIGRFEPSDTAVQLRVERYELSRAAPGCYNRGPPKLSPAWYESPAHDSTNRGFWRRGVRLACPGSLPVTGGGG